MNDTHNMNKRLKSERYAGTTQALQNDVVAFDDKGHCLGIIRHSGEHPLDEPKHITQKHLDEAAMFPSLYEVFDAKGKRVEKPVPPPTTLAPESILQEDEKAVHEGH